MRRVLLALFCVGLIIPAAAQDLVLPAQPKSLKFAVIGDSGTGDQHQREVGRQLAAWHARFPFEFVLMVGDNMYGSDGAKDYVRKFEEPYKPLLSTGVKFYAALGNHDNPNQRFYKPFNMNGERFYSFKPSLIGGARFFALDSNYMSPEQLEWFNKELGSSGSDWKIAFFHHPLYSSGDRHGSVLTLRDQLEPTFIKHGVNVVLTGHDHFYERLKPQKGIEYFVVGSSAKLRRGDNTSDLTAKTYDEGYAFMLVEIEGDNLHFQTINERGVTVDKGVVRKDAATNKVIGTSGTAPRPSARP
ncbi:Alkaline phosphatase precursor [Luteitalea pratensis]|uniref:Alkaline phosphatase n=1 Tax=Luteitalea pratensis TaxID=1855912 RepID=A0A143PIJ1_LUTPR|nr:metallophosphoesterase [Luteitalea pratensis]AMY08392.1 Alkaline phosphatase precursor [Luteitalea pratensis]